MLEQLMKYCSLWKGLTLKKFMRSGPHTGTGTAALEKEAAKET